MSKVNLELTVCLLTDQWQLFCYFEQDPCLAFYSAVFKVKGPELKRDIAYVYLTVFSDGGLVYFHTSSIYRIYEIKQFS